MLSRIYPKFHHLWIMSEMALCAAWLRKREIGGLSIAPTAGESPIDALLS